VTLSSEPIPEWMEITIDIDPSARESVSAFLFDLGCTGVVTEDFNDPTLKAYLPMERDLEEIRNRIDTFLRDLKEIFPESKFPAFTVGPLQREDWGTHWRRFFRPAKITHGLTILPAWEPVPSNIHGRVIRIDPGPAFGTGQHPTTRMCLKAMERGQPTPPWTMLDVGTGSGILAIYGAKLGAGRVVGIDIDPEALRWAAENLALNGLSGEIVLSTLPLEEWEDSFSLVTANLILGTILELFPHLLKVLDPGGRLILSGLLREQADGVKERAEKSGLEEVEILLDEEWAAVVGRKPFD
jgi:ribosomal protein L11 methyltransferase